MKVTQARPAVEVPRGVPREVQPGAATGVPQEAPLAGDSVGVRQSDKVR